MTEIMCQIVGEGELGRGGIHLSGLEERAGCVDMEAR